MSYHLHIDYHTAEGLIRKVLKEDLDSLRGDWNKVYVMNKGFVFSSDPKEDLDQISEIISALKKVLRHYGEKV